MIGVCSNAGAQYALLTFSKAYAAISAAERSNMFSWDGGESLRQLEIMRSTGPVTKTSADYFRAYQSFVGREANGSSPEGFLNRPGSVGGHQLE